MRDDDTTEADVQICEYCGEVVPPPYPVHPVCARVWLMGYHAAEKAMAESKQNA